MTGNIDTDTANLQRTKKHNTHRPRTSLILQLKTAIIPSLDKIPLEATKFITFLLAFTKTENSY